MKRVKVFFGLIGITFLAGVLLFYYKTDIPLESSYLQGNIWGASEQENIEQHIAGFTNSCEGLHVELVSLGGQTNETRKKLDETIAKAAIAGEEINALQKRQEEVLGRINKLKEEKAVKESLPRKTQYTLNAIERLSQEQKAQEKIWTVGNSDLEKKKTELSHIQASLAEIRAEVATFEKQMHAVEENMTKCTTNDLAEKKV